MLVKASRHNGLLYSPSIHLFSIPSSSHPELEGVAGVFHQCVIFHTERLLSPTLI